MSKTKNHSFSNGIFYNKLDKKLLILFSKTQISEFSILHQFPKFLKDIVPRSFWGCYLISSVFQPHLFALFRVLQKLYEARGQAREAWTWEGASLGQGTWAHPWLLTGKRLRTGTPGNRGCGVVYPIPLLFCTKIHLPTSEVSPFWPESPWRFLGLDIPKKPQQLNFWPALLYWIICQVATLPSPILQHKH